MEINKKQIIYGALVIIWMVVVFMFSNQPAEKSSKQSGEITDKVVKAITKDSKEVTQSQKDTIETIVRKCAHFVLYLIGGFLMANFINTTKVQNMNIIIYAILFTLIYACTDEVHQYFVEGRSCELRDIFIDTAGGSIGTLTFWMFRKILRRK